MAGVPQPVHVLPESPSGVLRTEGQQGVNHRRILPSPVHHQSVVRGPPQSYRVTGPLNWQIVCRHQILNDPPPLSGPYSFFAMTSFSATFSKDRSAYIRFRRLFSCSSSLSRFTSEAANPPYFAFHL